MPFCLVVFDIFKPVGRSIGLQMSLLFCWYHSCWVGLPTNQKHSVTQCGRDAVTILSGVPNTAQITSRREYNNRSAPHLSAYPVLLSRLRFGLSSEVDRGGGPFFRQRSPHIVIANVSEQH